MDNSKFVLKRFVKGLVRREVGIRTQLPSAFYHTDVRTDCAPLIKVRERRDVSRLPLDGQTSINQFLFEKAIFHDAFYNVVNDAVNNVVAIATPRDVSVADGWKPIPELAVQVRRDVVP